MTFGERLKSLRKKAGLTQEKLADLIGVHETTIRRWENQGDKPRIEEVKALAKALNVPESDLLHDPPQHNDGWVLQFKVAHELSEEVIDLSKNVPVECSITATPKGAYLTLGGGWSLWTKENKKLLLKQIDKFFSTVQQNGIAFGGLPES